MYNMHPKLSTKKFWKKSSCIISNDLLEFVEVKFKLILAIVRLFIRSYLLEI